LRINRTNTEAAAAARRKEPSDTNRSQGGCASRTVAIATSWQRQ